MSPTLQLYSLLAFYPLLISFIGLWWIAHASKDDQNQIMSFPGLSPKERLTQKKRTPQPVRTKSLWFGIFIFYLTSASLLTQMPVPLDLNAYCDSANYLQQVGLNPFHGFESAKRYLAQHPDDWTIFKLLSDGYVKQAYLNILLTIPLGLFLVTFFKLSFKYTIGIGCGIGFLWELTQLTGTWWLAPCSWRMFETNDLITNTIGIAFGALLGMAANKIFGRSNKRKPA